MSVQPNIWPRYSFIQDSGVAPPSDCYPDPSVCLPLSSWSNVSCQVQVDGTEPLLVLAAAAPGTTSQIYLTPVAPDFPCSYDIQYSLLFGSGYGFTYTHHPVVYDLFAIYDDSTSPYVYLYFNLPNDSGNMDDVTSANNTIAVPVGSCFKFALVWDIYNPSGELSIRFYYGCTNCFTRTNTNECFTSVLRYTNPEDAFDFHYSGPNVISPYNIVELPFYLRDPKMENDQKVYTRSDGTIVKLFERKEEAYTLETDLIPYAWHKALDIALSHDTVTITNLNASSFDPINTATQFIKKDNYEIEYMKAPFTSYGKGSCKLLNADPIHLINNNCS